MKYTLYKKPHPTDDFCEFDTYDTSDPRGLEALLKAVYDFGRWMYTDYKIEEVIEDVNDKDDITCGYEYSNEYDCG